VRTREEAEANRRAARQRAEEEAVLARRLRTVGDLWDRCAKEVVAIENKPSTVPQKSATMAPAKSPDEAAELLSALLRVQSEGWQALADAMSQGLFDRLKRWHAAGLAKNRP